MCSSYQYYFLFLNYSMCYIFNFIRKACFDWSVDLSFLNINPQIVILISQSWLRYLETKQPIKIISNWFVHQQRLLWDVTLRYLLTIRLLMTCEALTARVYAQKEVVRIMIFVHGLSGITSIKSIWLTPRLVVLENLKT